MNSKKIIDSRHRLSRETGTVIKDWGGRLPVALIYPNSYYIGMSNLGIHTIYSLLNGYPNVVCERVFYEKDKKGDTIPPMSLESQRPFSDFSVLAFSVTYELDFFNVVRLLRAGGIPLYAADRDIRHPLLIAGGPCITADPLPLAPFFDCLYIGEAEVTLPAVLDVLEKGAGENRDGLLRKLAGIPGIYVPQVNHGKPVARQWLKNLDDYPSHSVVLTPATELGSLYLIETERGCNWGCRFCLVSTAFSPARYRSPENILAQAEEGLKYRKRIGLVGPDVSGHPQFEEILSGLKNMGAGISVSSLRVKPLSETALDEITGGNTKTIALAPEAGSQRLRDIIRKGITEDDILKAMHKVAARNIRQLKLYYMIGLPTETEEDINEIISLTLRCKEILDSNRTGCRITLSVAPFVPKAGTPFQRHSMAGLPALTDRVSLLKKKLSPAGITVKADSPAWSRVQGILARGDTRLAEALASMENTSLSEWKKAMNNNGLDEDSYLNERNASDSLPWSFISHG